MSDLPDDPNSLKGAFLPDGLSLWICAFLAMFCAAKSVKALDAVGCFPIYLAGASDSLICPPLERASVFQGRVTTVQGNRVVFEASPGWGLNELAGAGTAGEYFACVVNSGPLAGTAYPILSNDAGTIRISFEGDFGQVVAARLRRETVRIVPYWTPRSLFAHSEVPNRSILFLYDNDISGVNKSPVEVFTYYAGYGWYQPDFSPADDYPLPRGLGLRLRLPSDATERILNVIGTVPPSKDRRRWETAVGNQTDLHFGLNHPERCSLAEAGLSLPDRSILFVWSHFSGYNTSPDYVFTYYKTYGWYDAWFNRVDTWFELEPGFAYRLRLPATASPVAVEWHHRPSYLDVIE